MIWAGRTDHMVGDMTHIAGIPSSYLGETKGSLELSSIPRPAVSVVLQKIEEENQNFISSQRTLREAQNIWRLLKL